MTKKLDPTTLQFVDSQEDLAQTLEVDGDEFLAEMAERGLIIPRPPTTWERLKSAVIKSFGLIGRGLSLVAWKLWGRRAYERRSRSR